MPALTLPIRCDRAAAEAILPDLIAAMGSDPVVIDGQDVRQAGQAMLQLLVSARRSGAGARLIASPALRDAIDLAGLTSELFDGDEPA